MPGVLIGEQITRPARNTIVPFEARARSEQAGLEQGQ